MICNWSTKASFMQNLFRSSVEPPRCDNEGANLVSVVVDILRFLPRYRNFYLC